MIRHGEAPFLECSSKGDRRFSAFAAKPASLRGKSIEEAYQGMKQFITQDDRPCDTPEHRFTTTTCAKGTKGCAVHRLETGLHWRRAKGRTAINQAECAAAYKEWWREWVEQEDLLPILQEATGLSDIYGQVGHVCQATVLWELRNEEWDSTTAPDVDTHTRWTGTVPPPSRPVTDDEPTGSE